MKVDFVGEAVGENSEFGVSLSYWPLTSGVTQYRSWSVDSWFKKKSSLFVVVVENSSYCPSPVLVL